MTNAMTLSRIWMIFQNRIYSYSYSANFPNPNSIRIGIRLKSGNRIVCFSVVFTGVEDPVCNINCSKFLHLLLFNGFCSDIRYYSYSYLVLFK